MLSKNLLSSLYRMEDGRLISKITNLETGRLGTEGRYVTIFDEEIPVEEVIKVLTNEEE